jgi:serine/threonine protein kinase
LETGQAVYGTLVPVLLLFYYPVEFIHSRHYCHNDIKAQNILLGPGQDHNAVYLIDFGLACKYKGETSGVSCNGTLPSSVPDP